MNNVRYLAVVLLLLSTALILHAHGSQDRVPQREPISHLPVQIDGWNGTDMKIDQQSLDVLGSGEFLSRTYTREDSPAPVGLFIAYFPTQRTGSTIHSPKNCLPGAGWYFDSSKYVNLVDANGNTSHVGEYVVTNGDLKDFVIYWYLAHGRSVANEYKAKFYLVADAIRTNRTDGSLIRVLTPVAPGESVQTARSRAEGFAQQLIPQLTQSIPK
jgi:EpsI family protein